jgi:hypothetical protein
MQKAVGGKGSREGSSDELSPIHPPHSIPSFRNRVVSHADACPLWLEVGVSIKRPHSLIEKETGIRPS